MSDKVLKLLEDYTEGDAARWAKLNSTVTYRRLELLLLREILLELRALNQKLSVSAKTS